MTAKHSPTYYNPARQEKWRMSRQECAAFLRRMRARKAVIRGRLPGTYYAPATWWTNWSIETKPRL